MYSNTYHEDAEKKQDNEIVLNICKDFHWQEITEERKTRGPIDISAVHAPASGCFVDDQLHWHVPPRERQNPNCCRRALQQGCHRRHKRYHCFSLYASIRSGRVQGAQNEETKDSEGGLSRKHDDCRIPDLRVY